MKSRLDPLTAVLDEMRLEFPMADLEDDLMGGVLQAGNRLLPTVDDIDRLLAANGWLD